MTMLEQMLQLNPVHLCKRSDGYHCTWSVSRSGVLLHARGVSETPGGAMFQAWKNAKDNGWLS